MEGLAKPGSRPESMQRKSLNLFLMLGEQEDLHQLLYTRKAKMMYVKSFYETCNRLSPVLLHRQV